MTEGNKTEIMLVKKHCFVIILMVFLGTELFIMLIISNIQIKLCQRLQLLEAISL
jgi:hypothetical protein